MGTPGQGSVRGAAPARRGRRSLVAAVALALAACGCTMYDPRVSAAPAASPRTPTRVVRVCGEAQEFGFAERVLAATGLFARVKPCTDPFDPSDLQVRVRRPYFQRDPIAVSFIYSMLTAGVIPTIACQPDLAFQFYPSSTAIDVVPDRTTCVLYGWLPPLLAPLPAFHWGSAPSVERAAAALRAAILTQAPGVVDGLAPPSMPG